MKSKQGTFRTFTSLEEADKLRPGEVTSSGAKVYRNVTLIKAGLGNRRDKNFYPASVLKTAVESGMFEGLKAYADHQTSVDEEIQPERTVRDFVGLYSDTHFDESDGGRVVGDLRVLRSQKWLSETIDELIEMGAADKIGLSINGRGQTEPKKVQLEESGEEIDANVLQRFIDVRSTDVVTEAGAGGGFQHILESARGAAKESGTMTTKQLATKLHEAAEAGDLAKVKTLTVQLTECACAEVAAVKEGFKKKKKGGAAEDAKDGGKDDAMEEADDDAADDTEAEDHENDLEEAVEKAKTEGDEVEDEDNDAEADTNEADEEPEDDAEPTRENRQGTNDLKGVPKAGAGGNMTKRAKSAGKPGASKIKPHGDGRVGVREADLPADIRAELARLRTHVQKSDQRNERLAEALRVRQKADVARKLLKESGIPAELRADLVGRLVRLPSEDAMQSEIRFQQRLLETAASRAREEFEDSFTQVEGAGSRVRESYGGGDDELVELLRESGLPIRKKESK